MARGISWGGTPLPVTDASISSSREPVREQSMSGLGGEALYGGVYGPAQGSFSGALRGSLITIINEMLEVSPASVAVVVVDDFGNGLTANNCFLSGAEISVRAGELARVSCNFVGMSLSAGGSVGAASYAGTVPVFYNSSTTWGTCSGFTVKINRPYNADDYIIGNDQFFSQSIYQSGETTVSGTITLSQATGVSLSDPGSMTFTLDSNTITITGAVLSNAEKSISGRGLIIKTFSWACPSTGITIA